MACPARATNSLRTDASGRGAEPLTVWLRVSVCRPTTLGSRCVPRGADRRRGLDFENPDVQIPNESRPGVGMRTTDMSIQRDEIFVSVDGTAAFPAIVENENGRLIPRLRPAIAARLVKWTEANHYDDDGGTAAPLATWVGNSIRLVSFDGGGGEPETQWWFRPDSDGRYRIDFWTWREHDTRPHTANSILAHATRFTFDHNAVEAETPLDRDIEVTVERVRPDEWSVNWNSRVYNHETQAWDSEYAASRSTGSARWAYYTGRDEAVECALTRLAEVSADIGATAE